MGRTRRRRRKRQTSSKDISDAQSEFIPELFKYLSAAGWQNHTALSVRNYPHTGRGLCSKKRSFHVGDELIRLPVNCLITAVTLEADDAFKAQFSANNFVKEQRIPFQSLMALYVLHIKHRLQTKSSLLRAYIDSIPTTFTMPYFCTINELQCLPDAVLEKTAAQNRKIRESYAHLKSAFVAENCSCCAQNYFDVVYPLADFKWAYFAVNSRSVYLNCRDIKPVQWYFQALLVDEPNLALAPFLDLFNHAATVETKAELVRSVANKCFEYVVTLRQTTTPTIKSHAQLHISYGPLSNLRLLTEYGFLLRSNLHDYFEFSLPDIEQWLKHDKCLREHTFHSNKFKFIRAHNLHDQMFVHATDGLSHNLRVVLYLLFKEPSYYPNVLQQVAFGAAEQFQHLTQEASLLIEYKIAEYQRFYNDLRQQPPAAALLSASGTIALEYLDECMQYLRKSLEII